MEKNNTAKRRIYFIDKKFQSNFILKFCLLALFGGVITIGLLYLLAGSATTVSIVNSRVMVRSTADFLLPVLFQTVVVAFVVTALATIVVTMYVSHKIAGPLFRFRKVVEGIGQGDFSRTFKLRTNDQMQELAESMNQMIKANRLRIGNVKELTGMLKSNLDHINEQDVNPGKASTLNEMKRVARELKAVADGFKA